jgi:hypothetical protein
MARKVYYMAKINNNIYICKIVRCSPDITPSLRPCCPQHDPKKEKKQKERKKKINKNIEN